MWRAFDGPEGKAAVPRFPRAAARPGNDPKHLATRQRTMQYSQERGKHDQLKK